MNIKKFTEYCRDYLNKNSPLRQERKFSNDSGKFLINSPKMFYFLGFFKSNKLECRDSENLISFNGGNIPIFEIACNPVSNVCLEDLYNDKAIKVILDEEIECFNLISKYPGNKTILLIGTDLTVLDSSGTFKGKKEYGLSLFENIGVVRGFDLTVN
jgi:hypothetical protein